MGDGEGRGMLESREIWQRWSDSKVTQIRRPEGCKEVGKRQKEGAPLAESFAV